MENFWNKRRVFITGANGFLGSHLTHALIEKGAKPVVLIYEDTPGSIFHERDFSDHTTIVRGDIRNFRLVDDIIRKHDIEIIFHLAAQAIVDQAIDDPLDTFEVNIQGTWNILEASKKNPSVKRVVVASSDKAYGEHESLPYSEDTHHLKAGYPYEVSKAAADLITQSFYRTFNVPVCITRCANLYGPGDMKITRLVPRTILNLSTDTPPVIRDTGSSLRDYLFVEDAVEACVMLAEKMDDMLFGEIFNFSTNKPLSVLDMIQLILKEMGKEIEPEIIRTHGMEIRHQYASFDKAKRLLGWTPKHDVVAGLRKTIPWYVHYFENAKRKPARILA